MRGLAAGQRRGHRQARPDLEPHLKSPTGTDRPVGEALVGQLFADGETGRIPVAAVTGVNGKTTTTRLIAHVVGRTHRCVVVAEDTRTGSMAAEIVTRVTEQAFDELDAPVERVTGEDVPMPYARNLELLAVPDDATVIAAARRTVWRDGAARQPIGDGTNGQSETEPRGRRLSPSVVSPDG